jgi:hypothetical protein
MWFRYRESDFFAASRESLRDRAGGSTIHSRIIPKTLTAHNFFSQLNMTVELLHRQLADSTVNLKLIPSFVINYVCECSGAWGVRIT